MKTYSIGRGDENDVVIRDHSVSRNHAELRVDDEGQFQLVDLNSTNGTFVRDGSEWVQVYQAYVAEDERIMFGSTATTLTALLARKPIEPEGTLTGADIEEPAQEEPADPEETQEDAAQGSSEGKDPGRKEPERKENVKIDDPPAGEGARSYEEYLKEKQDSEAPPPPAAPPPPSPSAASAGKKRGGRAPGWLKWAAAGSAALVLVGVGTFAALEFKDEVFGGGARKTTQTAKKSGPAKPALKGPSPTWESTFGGPGSDRVTGLQIAPGGGYLIAGYTGSSGSGGSKEPAAGKGSDKTKGSDKKGGKTLGGLDGWLVRLDANGNKLWEKRYGGARDDRIEALLHTIDGGYIAVGATKSKGAGDWDFWVLRLDANAEILWEKVYGGTSADIARGVVALRDGGFAIAGNSGAKSKDGNSRAWILKIDASGKKVWDRFVGAGRGARVNALGLTGEGGFILAGSAARGKRGANFWVSRLSPKGKQLWRYTTGGRARDVAHAVLATRDGGFVVAGETASRGYGKGDAFLIKLNAKGKRQWARVYGGRRPDKALALTLGPKRSYVLAGFSASRGRGGRDLWLARVSRKGGTQWERTHGGSGSEAAAAVLALAKGGFVVAGTIDSKGAGKEDVWVIKLDAKGFHRGGSAGPKARPGPVKPKKTAKKSTKKSSKKKRVRKKKKKKTN
ncbi:MAG: FHA domain-containing protein [Alphaproteobacteria bacterium]